MAFKTLNKYWNNNLLTVSGHDWRRIRSLTSPAFTGSKLRKMHQQMGRSVEKLVRHLNSTIPSASSSGDQESNSSSTVKIKSVIACFAIDVIASTSFACETDAIACLVDKDRESGNVLVSNCRQLFVIPPLRLGAVLVLPKFLLKLLGIDCFLPAKPFQYLINLTRHIVQERKAAGAAAPANTTSGIAAKRTDFLQLLIDSKVDEDKLQSDDLSSYAQLEANSSEDEKQSTPEVDDVPSFASGKALTGLSETEIIAQGIFFLTAGYETSSSTISHALYELARNPSIQGRVYEELQAALSSLDATGGRPSRSSSKYYETVISELPFLEATLKETLRLYAPVQLLVRIALTDGHMLENGLRLEKDQMIEIPVGAVHRSSEYYPQPEVFKPERFLPENRHLLVPYTYLPFGAGARNCIGIRFAMQEMKICLAALLENFEFSPASNTPKQLYFQRGTPVLNAAEFPLQMTRRIRNGNNVT